MAQHPPPQLPPSDMDDREALMKRDVLLVAIAGISLLNGMHFSPYFDPIALLLRPFIAGTVLSTPLVSLYVTSLFISLMSLLVAGIPAAIYERFKGDRDSTPASLGIWLGVLVLITLPAIVGAAR